jgi:predicted dehydrogenase
MNRLSKSQTNRREFLKRSTAAAAAASAVPYFAWTQPAFANRSPNDRPVIGCIGLGRRGTFDAEEHSHFGQIVAVCDVDSDHADAAKHNPRIGKGKAKAYSDYRKLLDDKDIDVVSIGTPDHWHVKPAIEALEAGKHVFSEKPLTLTLEENQLVRRAAAKYDKQVFFVGTQQRSERGLFLRAVNMVQKGLLGDIKNIDVGIDGGMTSGKLKKTKPPKELDWDFWLGQAPKVDYIPERCHRWFRWWMEYSGGKFTDWGAHHVDIATWAIQHDKQGLGPVEINGADARNNQPLKDGYPTRDDEYNTCVDFDIKVKYDNGIMMSVNSRSQNGILFEGTKGRLFVNRSKITGTPIKENWDKDKFTDADVVRLYKGKPFEGDRHSGSSLGHKANMYRCIREGGLPVSDVFSHVMTMNTCHLCALAARFNRTIHWDPKTETIVGDPQVAALFSRHQREGYEIHHV